jgi:GxxExxY protein
MALSQRSLQFKRQVAVPVWFRGHKVGDFRADLLVEGKVIVELKAGRAIEHAWEKQLQNYLRATDLEVGLLLNFGPIAEYRRLLFTNDRKQGRHREGDDRVDRLTRNL